MDIMLPGFAAAVDDCSLTINDPAGEGSGPDVRVMPPYIRVTRIHADFEAARKRPGHIPDGGRQNDNVSECIFAPDLNELGHSGTLVRRSGWKSYDLRTDGNTFLRNRLG